MNKKIDILENKVLKLKNVLIKEIKLESKLANNFLDIELKKMEDYILNNKLHSFGPIIFKTEMIESNNQKSIKIEIMIQLKDENIKVIKPYRFMDSLATPVCLFSRFYGKEEDLNMIDYKMKVYAYENNLLLGDIIYNVSKKIDDNVSVDTFVPIIGRY